MSLDKSGVSITRPPERYSTVLLGWAVCCLRLSSSQTCLDINSLGLSNPSLSLIHLRMTVLFSSADISLLPCAVFARLFFLGGGMLSTATRISYVSLECAYLLSSPVGIYCCTSLALRSRGNVLLKAKTTNREPVCP